DFHVTGVQTCALPISESRIVELAVAIVARIAPRLDQGDLISALIADALAAIHEERHVVVRVNGTAEKATRTMLDRWQCAHPEVEDRKSTRLNSSHVKI